MGRETISRKTFVRGVTAGVVVAASLGILAAGEYSIDSGNNPGENGPASNTPEVASSEAADSYVPGTYTASARGLASDIAVTATFDESGITALEVDVSGETPDIGDKIGDEMIEKILSAQSANVDGVAGATVTADALKAAVADCFTQAAKGEQEATEKDTEEGAVHASAASTSVIPGTYTASAKGMESDITVTATFDENGITEITADVSDETPGIGTEIGDPMIKKAMEAQSADIDGVAGATITSNAFKAALSDCMEQAGFFASAQEDDETETEEAVKAASAQKDGAAAEAAPDAPFIPGTYTASAKGFQSDIVVNVTFDENNIIAVGVYLSEETPDIGAAIGPKITDYILEAQSTDVDGVAGATVTSEAVKTALSDCIAQAKGESETGAIIGSADGPTSVFLAGTVDGEEESETETE